MTTNQNAQEFLTSLEKKLWTAADCAPSAKMVPNELSGRQREIGGKAMKIRGPIEESHGARLGYRVRLPHESGVLAEKPGASAFRFGALGLGVGARIEIADAGHGSHRCWA